MGDKNPRVERILEVFAMARVPEKFIDSLKHTYELNLERAMNRGYNKSLAEEYAAGRVRDMAYEYARKLLIPREYIDNAYWGD